MAEKPLDTNITAIALQGSFVEDPTFTYTDYATMAQNWVNIEDQPEIIDAIIDDDIDDLMKKIVQGKVDNIEEGDDGEGKQTARNDDSEDEGKYTYSEFDDIIFELRNACRQFMPHNQFNEHLNAVQKNLHANVSKNKMKSTTMHDFFNNK